MRILQLTSYPTLKPLHGGQIRSHQIALNLRQAGHEVVTVGIFPKEYYPDTTKEDIPIARHSIYTNEDLDVLADYLCGEFAANDKGVLHALANSVSIKPDLVLLEQPWLFMAARKVFPSPVKLVYSSQNIEWRLKRQMLIDRNRLDEGLVESVRTLEQQVMTEADLTIACTPADAADLGLMQKGDRTHTCVVAGNGVEPFSCDETDVAFWQQIFSKTIGGRYAAYVSSAHEPNATGFWDLMNPCLGFLKPIEQILVIGGVCSLLTHMPGIEPFRGVNASRLHLAGVREKKDLQAMLRGSHLVLLPITTGEGSNLKAAEALESGCRIVGTTRAFRGFEAAMTLPHVTVADTSSEFRLAGRKALDEPRHSGGTPLEVRSRYYWSNQLKPLVEAIWKLS